MNLMHAKGVLVCPPTVNVVCLNSGLISLEVFVVVADHSYFAMKHLSDSLVSGNLLSGYLVSGNLLSGYLEHCLDLSYSVIVLIGDSDSLISEVWLRTKLAVKASSKDII